MIQSGTKILHVHVLCEQLRPMARFGHCSFRCSDMCVFSVGLGNLECLQLSHLTHSIHTHATLPTFVPNFLLFISLSSSLRLDLFGSILLWLCVTLCCVVCGSLFGSVVSIYFLFLYTHTNRHTLRLCNNRNV